MKITNETEAQAARIAIEDWESYGKLRELEKQLTPDIVTVLRHAEIDKDRYSVAIYFCNANKLSDDAVELTPLGKQLLDRIDSRERKLEWEVWHNGKYGPIKCEEFSTKAEAESYVFVRNTDRLGCLVLNKYEIRYAPQGEAKENK